MTEFFVIRTRDQRYVGPLGFTADVEKAVFFPSRMGALAKCAELGAVLEGAAIVPYSPAKPSEGSRTGTGAKKAPERSTTPWKAGK